MLTGTNTPRILFFSIEKGEQANYPKSYIHDLDASTKLQLLTDGAGERATPGSTGADTLVRLHGLSDSIARDFQVKETALEKFQMRLYNEDPAFSKTPVTSYVAMSYRCKPQDPPGLFRSHYYPFDRPLFKAVLSQLFAHEGLWFDIGCIEQDDNEERGDSIRVMDIIYKRARAVVVALWDICLDEAEILMLEDYQQEFEDACAEHIQPTRKGYGFHPYDNDYVPARLVANPALFGFLIKLLGSEWFQRAFCGQEFRVSRCIMFLVPCGIRDGSENKHFFKFDAGFLLLLMDVWPRAAENRLINRDRRTNVIQSRARFGPVVDAIQSVLTRKPYRNRKEWLQKNSPEEFVRLSTDPLFLSLSGEYFMNTIEEIFLLQAGGNPMIVDNPSRSWDINKDKLTLTMNSIEHPLVYTGDIRGLEADICIEKLITVAIASSDAWALVCRGRPLIPNDTRTTWTHWPTQETAAVMQGFSVMLDPGAQLGFGTDRNLNANYIELGLRFLPFIDQPSMSCLQQSTIWIGHCDRQGIKCFIRRNPENPDGDFPQFPEIKNELFAYFLTQSPSWLPQRCTISDQRHNLELSTGVIEVLTMLMGFILIVIHHTQPTSAANDPEYHSWRPRMVKIENEVALVMAPPKAAIRLAVPDAIKSVACQHLSRCWILEPIESRSREVQEWRLLGKSLIFASPGFATVLERTASSSKLQRVFGVSTVP